ncbi:hypothetical protein ERJ75_000355400 [Trypanosoma vivax]|nr:hypothetical protein ERJ75_000505200 [Trypanosoma vivax]KAH8617593.1 hypothetical protein ERJ75_000355400 [Trypanosoma vivax]
MVSQLQVVSIVAVLVALAVLVGAGMRYAAAGRRRRAAPGGQDRATVRRRLMRQAVAKLLASRRAHEGIPLATVVGVNEALGDRQFGGDNRTGAIDPLLLTMRDGERAPISAAVRLVLHFFFKLLFELHFPPFCLCRFI